MLKNIPDLLSPDAVKLMMEMGHGDTILIADGNYPATTNNPRVIRADGHALTDLLRAVLELLPLDQVVDAPVSVMATGDGTTPPVWEEFRGIVHDAGDDRPFAEVERFDFYELGAQAAGVIQSGDRALFGNILLQKGTL